MLQATDDPPSVQAETKRISEILDAKYEVSNLKEVSKDILDLSKENKHVIYKLLKKYEILFD